MERKEGAPLEEPASELIQQKLALESQIRIGMNWFYWIAGLTFINSLIAVFGGKFVFIIGLTVPQITTAILQSATDQPGLIFPVLAFSIDAVLVGLFIVFGILGNKRNRLVILVALILYGLDGLLLLYMNDWLGLVFHGLAMYFIWKGFQSIGELNKLEKRIA